MALDLVCQLKIRERVCVMLSTVVCGEHVTIATVDPNA
jgi:hypothetical protein